MIKGFYILSYLEGGFENKVIFVIFSELNEEYVVFCFGFFFYEILGRREYFFWFSCSRFRFVFSFGFFF